MKIGIIIFLTSLVDLLTKWWSHSQLPDIALLGGWFQLTHMRNAGVAFSTPLPGIHIVVPIILGVLLIFMVTSWKQITEREQIGYALIFTGGFLNAFERSILGSVTDMISLKYFAVFNIADIAVSIGVFLLLWASFCQEKRIHKSLQITKK